jgi:hypothetical protein
MGDAVQARGWGEAGNVGCEIGKKKRKTSAPDMGSSFGIFDF